jgi:carnitine 3-dehydrogenase
VDGFDRDAGVMRDVAPWRPGEVPPAPIDLWRSPVLPQWVDYNDHMTEAAYLTAFGWGSDVMFRYVGIDEAYRASGRSLYTVETHIVYEREAALGEPLRVTTRVLDLDAKRVHIWHEMYRDGDDTRLSVAEQMLVHVDARAGRSAPMADGVLAAFTALHERHRVLPAPAEVGRTMRIVHRPRD